MKTQSLEDAIYIRNKSRKVFGALITQRKVRWPLEIRFVYACGKINEAFVGVKVRHITGILVSSNFCFF